MKTHTLKNQLLAAAILLITCFTSVQALAGTSHITPDEGYWVVETNIHIKDFSLVKMYNAQNQLIYEERLEGICINLKKRKHIKMLNNILKTVENNQLVAAQLKRYPQHIAAGLARKR